MNLLRSRLAAVGACVIGAGVIAGCGSSSTPSGGSSGTTAPTTPPATTSGGTTTGSTSTGGGAAATVQLQADPGGRLAFVETTLTAPAGKSTIELTNASPVAHNVEVEGAGKDFGPSPTISGGDKTTLSIDLPAGTYQYYCAVPGHKQAGMVGTLTVK